MHRLSPGLLQKGGEPVTGFRGPEGHGEAGKGDARIGYIQELVPAVGNWGSISLGPRMGPWKWTSELPLPSLAEVAHREVFPVHIPVCRM